MPASNDATTIAQLLLCPTTTFPAARLLRPHLPDAVRTLVNSNPTPERAHATTVALIRLLHIAPHLLDAMLPWLSSHPPPWNACLNEDFMDTASPMPPSDVVLAALHALKTTPRLLKAWSPASLPALLASHDGVLRWAALQCMGACACMSDAAMR